MRRTYFSSLRFRLQLLMLLSLAPASGLVLYTVSEQRRLAATDVQTNARQLARLAASQQEQLIEGARQLLVAFAELPSIRGTGAACSTTLATLLPQFPLYANFGVIQPDGAVTCSAVPLMSPLNLRDRSYFRRALTERQFAVGEYQIGRITNKASINFGYPILNETGSVEGVVFAALDLSWLNHLKADTELPDGGTLLVVDRAGTVLAHYPEGERWIGRTLPDAPLVHAVLQRHGEGTTETLGLDGVKRLYAFAPLGEGAQDRVYVVIGIPVAVALADANRLLRWNLILLGVVACLVLAATGMFGEWFIVKPAQALVEATKRLASGNFSVRAGGRYRQGELGQLAQAFDGMAASLERSLAERQHAEAAVRESEERFRTFMDHSPAVAFMKDADGRYVYVNQPFERRFQMTLAAWRGKTDFEVWPEDVATQLRAHDQAVMAADTPTELLETVPTPDSHPHYWLVYKFPVKDAAGRRFLGGMAVDITERREAERLKEEFLAVLSHELRIPLTTAEEGISQVIDGVHGAITPGQQECLTMVAWAHGRLHSLFDKVVRVTEIMAGQVDVTRKPIDVVALVRELEADVRPLADERGVALAVNDPGAVPWTGDAALLTEALRELAQNAIQVTEPQGHVSLSCSKHPDRVEVVISDTGPGIPEKELASLFERFHWVGGTDDRKTGGMGLGLFVAKSLIDVQGGTIVVTSTVGQGTRMTVKLPIAST